MRTKTIAAFTLVAVALAALSFYRMGRSYPASVEPQTSAGQAGGNLNRPAGGAALRADAAGQVAGRAPVAEHPPPPPLQDLESCWLLTDVEEATECIDAWLVNRPLPSAEQEIGSLICFENSTVDAPFDNIPLILTLRRTLRARASGDLMASIEAVREACPRVATSGCITRAVMDLREADPDLFEHIRQSLVPEKLFDPASGDAAIHLAVALADELDDFRLKQLVLDGARGRLGGTDAQTDLAAMCAVQYFEQGEDSLAYVEELLAAPFLPDGTRRSGLGSTLVALLTRPRIAGACEEARVLSVLRAVLDDPTVGLGAAAQVARQMSQEHPPDGLSPGEWSEIWLAASEMCRAAGLGG